jgi:hypothetical protein
VLVLSPSFLHSGLSVVSRAVDQTVVDITEYKEVDSKPYKTLLIQEAQEPFSHINSVAVLPPFLYYPFDI